jgi:hypothetical protein
MIDLVQHFRWSSHRRHVASSHIRHFVWVFRWYITVGKKRKIEIDSESIELFREDQVIPPSLVLAPPPPLPPSSVSKLFLFLSLPVCRRSSLLTGEGEGVLDKAWSSINYSNLFGFAARTCTTFFLLSCRYLLSTVSYYFCIMGTIIKIYNKD